jgi:hypothetical protein
MLRFVVCVQALPQRVRGDGVIPMVRMPLGNSLNRPIARVEMLVGQGERAIDPLAQVDDGDECMCSLLRSCRPVEDIDQLDGLHHQTRLLTRLAHRCRDRTLVGLDPATGQAPSMVVSPQHQQDLPAALKIAASAPTFGVTYPSSFESRSRTSAGGRSSASP